MWVFAAVLAILLLFRFLAAEAPAPADVPPPPGDDAAPTETNGALLEEETGLEVFTEDVAYFSGVMGRYVRPVEDGDWPGVVMVHEWWGLNEQIKDMAETLAAQGYAVLAVDLYGEVAETPDQARALSGGLDQAAAVQNLQAAKAFLEDRGAGKVASLGWCFGGGQTLQLALNEPLDATVIYYGRLVTDADELRAISSPVLGIFGEEDASIPVESVQAFDLALDEAGVVHDVYVYPGVGHAFANPSGAAYAPDETADAWAKTLAFLAEHLKE